MPVATVSGRNFLGSVRWDLLLEMPELFWLSGAQAPLAAWFGAALVGVWVARAPLPMARWVRELVPHSWRGRARVRLAFWVKSFGCCAVRAGC